MMNDSPHRKENGKNKIRTHFHPLYHHNWNQHSFFGYAIAATQNGKNLNQAAKEYIEYFDPHSIMSEESLIRMFYTMNKDYVEYRKNAG
jgi:hypothetical protein